MRRLPPAHELAAVDVRELQRGQGLRAPFVACAAALRTSWGSRATTAASAGHEPGSCPTSQGIYRCSCRRRLWATDPAQRLPSSSATSRRVPLQALLGCLTSSRARSILSTQRKLLFLTSREGRNERGTQVRIFPRQRRSTGAPEHQSPSLVSLSPFHPFMLFQIIQNESYRAKSESWPYIHNQPWPMKKADPGVRRLTASWTSSSTTWMGWDLLRGTHPRVPSPAPCCRRKTSPRPQAGLGRARRPRQTGPR